MTRLDLELERYLEQAEFPMIRHPLVYAVPFFDHPTTVARLNKQLAAKKEAVEKAFGESNWAQFVFLHERPYRIQAFMDVQAEMYDKEYWPLLAEIWTDSENIFQNHMQWWEMLSAPRQKRELFTNCEDRKLLRKMPRELTIYRGTKACERNSHYLGFSWTTDRERAEWFATRILSEDDGPPVVAEATCRKRNIVGYITGRGEFEVVVEPKHVSSLIKWRTL